MLFVRCAMTRNGQGVDPKPFLRNFFFNLLRQLGPQMVTLMIMDGTGYKRMVDVQKQVLYVFILTVIFQFVPKQQFRNFRYLYVWAEFEFKAALTMGAVLLMNKICSKTFLDGDLVTGIIIVSYAANFRIGWYFLEDLWYQDMGACNWFVIPSCYMPWITGIIGVTCMQIFYLGNDV